MLALDFFYFFNLSSFFFTLDSVVTVFLLASFDLRVVDTAGIWELQIQCLYVCLIICLLN